MSDRRVVQVSSGGLINFGCPMTCSPSTCKEDSSVHRWLEIRLIHVPVVCEEERPTASVYEKPFLLNNTLGKKMHRRSDMATMKTKPDCTKNVACWLSLLRSPTGIARKEVEA